MQQEGEAGQRGAERQVSHWPRKRAEAEGLLGKLGTTPTAGLAARMTAGFRHVAASLAAILRRMKQWRI